MKIRDGFVSNSSSSSFIISKDVLSPLQIRQIENHIEVCNNKEVDFLCSYAAEDNVLWDKGEAWEISSLGDSVKGRVTMDNFDMEHFLNLIGIKPENIKFGDYWAWNMID